MLTYSRVAVIVARSVISFEHKTLEFLTIHIQPGKARTTSVEEHPTRCS